MDIHCENCKSNDISNVKEYSICNQCSFIFPITKIKKTINNKNIQNCNKCNKCNGTNFEVTRDQDYVCIYCGTIKHSNMISSNADWNMYDDPNKSIRVTITKSLNQYRSLGSYIPVSEYGKYEYVYTKKDKKSGKEFIISQTRSLHKLNQCIQKKSKEQCEDYVIKELNCFDFSNCIKSNTLYYWNFIKDRKYKASKRKAVLCYCVYLAFLNNKSGEIISKHIIMKKMKVLKKDFNQAEKIFPTFLLPKNIQSTGIFSEYQCDDKVVNLFSPKISKLELKYSEFVPKCIELYNKYKNDLQDEHFTLKSIIGGIIYYTLNKSNKTISVKILKEVLNVSEPVMKKVEYQLLLLNN